MKNLRTILLLILGIAALAAANVWLMRRGVDARLVRRTQLFRLAGEATRLVVTRPSAAPTVLERRDGTWRILEPFAAAVERETVLRCLDGLAVAPVTDELRGAELVRFGRTRADFSLEPPALTVEVSAHGLTERVTFGSFTPSGDGVYAAVSDDDAVLVTPSNAFAKACLGAADFRRRSVLPLDPAAVVSLDVKRPSGSSMSLVLSPEGWKANGRTASPEKVRGLLADLAGARAQTFVWPTGATNEADRASTALLAVYGLDPESATTVTLKCRDGEESRVALGLDAGEGLVYALAEDGGAIVTVPSALADAVHQEALAFTDTRLFPVEFAAVASFSLSLGDTVCRVARGEKSGEWRLDSPVAAPAEATVAETLLNRVLSLSSSDVVPTGMVVSVVTNLDARIVAPDRVLGEIRLDDLRSKEILSIDPICVKRLVSTEAKRSTAVLFVRERRVWTVETASEKGAVDEKGIAAVLAALNPLRAERVEKLRVTSQELSRYGLDKPTLTLAIDQERDDSVRRNILIGAPAPGGGRYATVGSSDAVFILSDAVVSTLSRPLIVD